MIFLLDKGKTYSYDDLLGSLNDGTTYYPYYKTSDIYSFFVNLVKALASSKPLVLLDSDINTNEIDGLDVSKVNMAESIPPLSCAGMDEVLAMVQNSKSKITIFTSGTTGQPKEVVHSISTLTRSVRVGEKYRNQTWAYAYNPTHMAGLQVFFQAFENLNTIVNVFNQPREYVYHQIQENAITHISATPTFYRLLLPYERAYENVVRVTLGGEKSDQHLYDSIKKIFPNARINNVYASTEAGTLFAAKGDCFQIPELARDKYKVVDGELLIHKSLLGSSSSFKFTEDFYHSGDLIEWVDETAGLFRFKSRKNELINVGGYKVNPNEVETAIMDIEGVKQAMVYGRANSILGNVLCAEVVLEPGSEMQELDIKKHLNALLQDFKIPRKIKFVDEISLTRTGKKKRL
ncbi:MAG: long-chain fatty acid--CoA ligase [Prevotella sp.]|nr:long-chain fatty acid--CoA ligase [Prevotella sp.]